jgi:hypothetical protein
MAENNGTLVIAEIRPHDSADTYPTALSNELLGGLKQAADITARNLIPSERRNIGMMCYTVSEKKLFQLIDGITNDKWVEIIHNRPNPPRVQYVISDSEVIPLIDQYDCVDISAQEENLIISNPTGSPVNFQKLIIRIKDNGIIQAITWGSDYINTNVKLPLTTVTSKILNTGFIFNTANSLNKWQLVALTRE